MAPEIHAFLADQIRLNQDQGLLAPDEVHTFATELADLERQVGGEDAVIERIHHRALDLSLDAARALYQALKRVLAEADQQRAGFLWSTLYASAEQPVTEQLSVVQMARIQAKGATLEDAGRGAQWKQERDQDPNASIRDQPLRFVLMSKQRASPLRRRLLRTARSHRAPEDDYEGKMRLDRILADVKQLSLANAHEIIELDRLGERLAFISLCSRAKQRKHTAVQEMGVYIPRRAERLLRTLDQWQAEVGEDALLQQIVDHLPTTNTPELARSTYHALRRALSQVLEHDLILFVWQT